MSRARHGRSSRRNARTRFRSPNRLESGSRAFEEFPHQSPPMTDWLAVRESRYWTAVATGLAFASLFLVLSQRSNEAMGVASAPPALVLASPEAVQDSPALRPMQTGEVAEAVRVPTRSVSAADMPVSWTESAGRVANSVGRDEYRSPAVAPYAPVIPVAPPAFMGALIPQGTWDDYTLAMRSGPNSALDPLIDWRSFLGIRPNLLTETNRPNFVENGEPILGPKQQLLPVDKTLRSRPGSTETWTSRPVIFTPRTHDFPDRLSPSQRVELDQILRRLLAENVSDERKRPWELFDQGMRIAPEEPRLYYAMAVNSLRQHRFGEAKQYLMEAKDRTRDGYFAPWRDYIRLLAVDRQMDETMGELEAMAKWIARWSGDEQTASEPSYEESLNELNRNAEFLGRVSGFVVCTVGSEDHTPTIYLSREKSIEGTLAGELLSSYRTGRSQIESEISKQRTRDDARVSELHQHWRELLKTGQKETKNIDTTVVNRTIRSRTVNMQGTLGSGGFSPGDSNSFSRSSDGRIRFAENVSREHHTEFESLKMYRPYRRSEQFSRYEPLSPLLVGRDLLATLPSTEWPGVSTKSVVMPAALAEARP